MKVCRDCGSDAVTEIAYIILNDNDYVSRSGIFVCDICTMNQLRDEGIVVVDKNKAPIAGI